MTREVFSCIDRSCKPLAGSGGTSVGWLKALKASAEKRGSNHSPISKCLRTERPTAASPNLTPNERRKLQARRLGCLSAMRETVGNQAVQACTTDD
jgi:hypothetical protein